MPGTWLYQLPCGEGPAFLFAFNPVGNVYTRITSKVSTDNLGLAVQDTGEWLKTVLMFPDDRDKSQEWLQRPNGDGSYAFLNREPSARLPNPACMDVFRNRQGRGPQGIGSRDSVPIILQHCEHPTGPSQSWTVVRAPNPDSTQQKLGFVGDYIGFFGTLRGTLHLSEVAGTISGTFDGQWPKDDYKVSLADLHADGRQLSFTLPILHVMAIPTTWTRGTWAGSLSQNGMALVGTLTYRDRYLTPCDFNRVLPKGNGAQK